MCPGDFFSRGIGGKYPNSTASFGRMYKTLNLTISCISDNDKEKQCKYTENLAHSARNSLKERKITNKFQG